MTRGFRGTEVGYPPELDGKDLGVVFRLASWVMGDGRWFKQDDLHLQHMISTCCMYVYIYIYRVAD